MRRAPWRSLRGPDGNVWLAAYNVVANSNGTTSSYVNSQIDEYVTASGAVNHYPIPDAAGPTGIIAGPDGNLYFIETNANKIGQISTAAILREYSVNGTITQLTRGVDGNVWFLVTNASTTSIDKITTAGTITNYAIAAILLSAGPNGRMYYVGPGPYNDDDLLGSILPDGTSNQTASFANATNFSRPLTLELGRDGNFYEGAFEYKEYPVNRITPAASLTLFACFGQYRGQLADGTLVYTDIPNYNFLYVAGVRPDGSCASAPAVTLNFAGGPVAAGAVPGIAYTLDGSGTRLTAFNY